MSTVTPIPVVNTDPATDLFLGAHSAATTSDSAEHDRRPNGRSAIRSRLSHGTVREWARPGRRERRVRFACGMASIREGGVSFATRGLGSRSKSLSARPRRPNCGACSTHPDELADPARAPYVRSLRAALDSVLTATTASHLQHNEVWSYRIVGDRLLPTRYGSSSDVQLWSTTDLAVQFALERLPRF